MEKVQSKMDEHVLTKLYPPPSPSDMAGWITPQKLSPIKHSNGDDEEMMNDVIEILGNESNMEGDSVSDEIQNNHPQNKLQIQDCFRSDSDSEHGSSLLLFSPSSDSSLNSGFILYDEDYQQSDSVISIPDFDLSTLLLDDDDVSDFNGRETQNSSVNTTKSIIVLDETLTPVRTPSRSVQPSISTFRRDNKHPPLISPNCIPPTPHACPRISAYRARKNPKIDNVKRKIDFSNISEDSHSVIEISSESDLSTTIGYSCDYSNITEVPSSTADDEQVPITSPYVRIQELLQSYMGDQDAYATSLRSYIYNFAPSYLRLYYFYTLYILHPDRWRTDFLDAYLSRQYFLDPLRWESVYRQFYTLAGLDLNNGPFNQHTEPLNYSVSLPSPIHDNSSSTSSSSSSTSVSDEEEKDLPSPSLLSGHRTSTPIPLSGNNADTIANETSQNSSPPNEFPYFLFKK